MRQMMASRRVSKPENHTCDEKPRAMKNPGSRRAGVILFGHFPKGGPGNYR